MEVTRNTPAAPSVSEAKPARRTETQALQQQEAKRQTEKPAEQQERPRPVVNSQGQQTGRILNATA